MFPAKIVEDVIEYVYKGTMDIPKEEIQDVLVVADYLQLYDLKETIFDNVRNV